MTLNYGERIAEGRTAEIYADGEGRILKLWRSDFPPHIAEEEAQVTRAVIAAGVDAPQIFDSLVIDGRGGIVMERIDAPTMVALLQQDFGGRWEHLAREMGRLHATIHRHRSAVLSAQRDRFRHRIGATEHLTDAQKAALLAHLERLPQDTVICHGDFHPFNILVQGERLRVIDWNDAMAGHPGADVARTVVIFREVAATSPLPLSDFMRVYLEAYFAQSDRTKCDVDSWIPVVAAARLVENIAETRPVLLDLITAFLA